MSERLHKVIAGAGLCSRREAERLIEAGEVAVNGRKVTRLGVSVDPDKDRIEVYKKRLRLTHAAIYAILNKPRGTVTTARDPQGRPTVVDLMASLGRRVYPVGRLDYNAEGLLIMTNDGDLAYALMRPGGVPKTYRVKVRGTPAPESLDVLREGMMLEGERLLPVHAILESRGETSWLRLTLHEGRKNQILRMMQALGHPVRRLRRTRIGPIQLGTLPSGRWRLLEPEEIAALRDAASGRLEPSARRDAANGRRPPASRRTAREREDPRVPRKPGGARRSGDRSSGRRSSRRNSLT